MEGLSTPWAPKAAYHSHVLLIGLWGAERLAPGAGEQAAPLLLPRLPGVELRVSVRYLDLSLSLPPCVVSWLLAFATGILKSFISPYTGVYFPGDSFSVFSVNKFPSWRDCF